MATDAYKIMDMAKQYGAAARNLEAWDAYMDKLQSFKEKQAKGSFLGGLASMGIGALMPALIPAAGGSILDMATKALGRGSIGGALSETAYKLFGGKYKAPKFKSAATGPQGRAERKRMERKAKEITQGIESDLAGGKRGRAFTTILQAIMPEIKARGGVKEFFEQLGGGDIPFFSEEQDKSIADFFSKLGKKDISVLESFGEEIFDSKGKDEAYIQMVKDMFDPTLANAPYENLGGFTPASTFDKISPKQASAMQVTPSRISPNYANTWFPEGGTQPTSYLESVVQGATSPRQFSPFSYQRYSQQPYGKGMPSLSMLEYLLKGGK